MSTSLVATYELLRTEVLRGQARPEGLGAVVFHGLIDGLTLLCSPGTGGLTSAQQASTPQPAARDRELLRLLANMVLQTQSEVKHVY